MMRVVQRKFDDGRVRTVYVSDRNYGERNPVEGIVNSDGENVDSQDCQDDLQILTANDFGYQLATPRANAQSSVIRDANDQFVDSQIEYARNEPVHIMYRTQQPQIMQLGNSAPAEVSRNIFLNSQPN